MKTGGRGDFHRQDAKIAESKESEEENRNIKRQGIRNHLI